MLPGTVSVLYEGKGAFRLVDRRPSDLTRLRSLVIYQLIAKQYIAFAKHFSELFALASSYYYGTHSHK